jgi:opacity protein-like surface antigen
MLYIHRRRSPQSQRRHAYPYLLLPALLVCWLSFPGKAAAQGLELAGGWTHITGNQGTDGFNFGAGWNFTNKVLIAADYDTAWDNSRIGTFELTSIGALTSKAHLQNFMFGPRIFFGSGQVRNHTYHTFAEAQFGLSHLNTKITAPAVPELSTSDTAFSWMLGGGADYVINPHWTARGKLDFLRTHFADTGQSRLRLAIGIAYTFGSRER